LGKLN